MDVRGFTSLSERVPPSELAQVMNDFYGMATNEVIARDGTVDKFVGDQIMAFFGAPFRADGHAERAVEAAEAIVGNVPTLSRELRVGGGVASGQAYVGNVGGDEINDFTVLGDVVNVAARLQGAAAPGEILLADEAYRRVKGHYPDLEERDLQLKGKSAAITAWVVQTSSAAARAA